MTLCEEIVVEEVALAHVFLPVLRFYLVTIDEPMLICLLATLCTVSSAK